MQRIQYRQYGGPDAMRLETYTPPLPRRGEIRIRVKAASVNPLDWQLRQGFMKFVMGNHFPRGMGMDLAGIVEAIGPEVKVFSVGDEVLGQTPMNNQNAFSELAVTKADLVIPKPCSLSFTAAAALPSVGLIAWRALVVVAELKEGQSVLINGASGGVGQAALAIAETVGCVVSARVGTTSMREMENRGLAFVLDYNQPIPTHLRHSFDVVLDCHGSLTAKEEESLIRSGGFAVDIVPNVGNLLRSLISPKHRFARGAPSNDILLKVADLAVAGKFPLPVGRTAHLFDAIAMIRDLEAGKRVAGKAVIVMD
ncbi:NADP-dependent oxidoreductase [Jiella mangrovi]|uniref:NADP-dependent oxidoreductase n=1 Tax=Jiella mangrovi TaxID=2821407 RepID=A0ABS4BM11_9HYPH|nr:NADP-dependent oxidoreductase [Jiella mangrovi]MBP0617756.1 NADP-dependent oxidoreductase [Jiella mangrovi]